MRSTALLTGLLLVTSSSPVGSIEIEPALPAGQDRRSQMVGGIASFTLAGTQTLNTYSALAGNAFAGADTVTVADASELDSPIPAIGDLAVGDLLLVIQMQGASMDVTDAPSFGAVTDLSDAGHFELVTLVSRSGNTLTVTGNPAAVSGCTSGLVHSYSGGAGAQVVRVPQFGALGIPTGTTLVARRWNGSVGGVAVVQVSGALTLNGTVDVSAAGFRGGTASTLNSSVLDQSNATYRSADLTLGAEKGESIAGSQATYDSLNGRLGRGAPANGGGGGDAHNAGGGGGANGDVGPAWGMGWTGQGDMDLSVLGGAAAWPLDPDFASGGSTGGGRGGYSFANFALDPTFTAPGSSAWGGDYRRQVGGLGGRPLPNDPSSRLFLGGGGGAGDANNDAGGSGGNGGGLIILLAGSVEGTGMLVANGGPGGATHGTFDDGAGGGGGGGTIVVSAAMLTASLTLQANGGNGGNNQLDGATLQSDGPGGGGGGGYVAVSGGSPSVSVSAGAGGISTSVGTPEFPSNGATNGAPGPGVVTVGESFTRCQPTLPSSSALGPRLTVGCGCQTGSGHQRGGVLLLLGWVIWRGSLRRNGDRRGWPFPMPFASRKPTVFAYLCGRPGIQSLKPAAASGNAHLGARAPDNRLPGAALVKTPSPPNGELQLPLVVAFIRLCKAKKLQRNWPSATRRQQGALSGSKPI